MPKRAQIAALIAALLIVCTAGPTSAQISRSTSDVISAYCYGTINAGAATYFLFPGGTSTGCATASTSSAGNPFPVAGKMQNLRVKVATGSAALAPVVVNVNGTASALTCQIPAPAATTCSDLTHTVAVSAGDIWTISVVAGASDGSTSIRASFQLVSP